MEELKELIEEIDKIYGRKKVNRKRFGKVVEEM